MKAIKIPASVNICTFFSALNRSPTTSFPVADCVVLQITSSSLLLQQTELIFYLQSSPYHHEFEILTVEMGSAWIWNFSHSNPCIGVIFSRPTSKSSHRDRLVNCKISDFLHKQTSNDKWEKNVKLSCSFFFCLVFRIFQLHKVSRVICESHDVSKHYGRCGRFAHNFDFSRVVYSIRIINKWRLRAAFRRMLYVFFFGGSRHPLCARERERTSPAHKK